MRVIHLPTTVGGNPQGLSRHLQKLGVQSETWVTRQNYIAYPADKVLFKASDSRLLKEIKKLWALRYIRKCDVAFFNYGSGLYLLFSTANYRGRFFFQRLLERLYLLYTSGMARLEIQLIRRAGVPLFIQFQGDDARQGDFCRENFPINFAGQVEPGYYSNASDRAKRRRIAYYANVAAKMYALNPDLLWVLPKAAEFLPYSHIDLSEWAPLYTQAEERPLRVGHAPSHRGVKGTELILAAVEQLKAAGFEFELILVEGHSNEEAKEIYKSVDIVVDQLFAGWYGGVAVEAMALGKPVIAYIRDEDLHFIPTAMRDDLPVIRAEPDSIYMVLEWVLNASRAELLEIAKQSRAYVERWHDPLQIARRVKNDMERALGKAA